MPEYGEKVKKYDILGSFTPQVPPQKSSWVASWQRRWEVIHSYEHLLEQPALEGLGLGDLGGDAFDLAVEGGKEIGDLSLFGEGGTLNADFS